MPVFERTEEGRDFYQCGDQGKKYFVDDLGRKEARQKAINQCLAIGDEIEVIEKEHTGVMTGFFLPKEVSEKIALKDGESIDDLHLTIAFHGDKSELPEGSQEKMQKVIKEFVKIQPSIKGKINGVGRFNPTKNSGEKSVLFAIFDAPDLPQFRQDLIKRLEEEGIPTKKDHGFVPHITLAYFDKDFDVSGQEIGDHEITFDELTIAFGSQRQSFPFRKSVKKEGDRMDFVKGMESFLKFIKNEKVDKRVVYSAETIHAVEGALRILQDFSNEIPPSIFQMLNAIVESDVVPEIEKVNKQELSGEAQRAVVGAIRILQEFEEELPTELFDGLTNLLGEKGVEELTRRKHPDSHKRGKDKMKKELYVDFIQKNEEKRIVMGVVLEPNTIDAHDDFVSPETIEKVANEFMIESRTIGKQHADIAKDVKVVQSFIAPVDFELSGQQVKKGSWIMAVKVMNDQIWQQVKKGEFTGFSIGGFGQKEERDLPVS